MILRPLTRDDRDQYAQMVHRAFNTWYGSRGWPADYFGCAPEQAGIFLDIYEDISPGGSVAAFDPHKGDMMGACFSHPREKHVSLDVMSVNRDYFKRGIGRALVNHIIAFSDTNQYPALRPVFVASSSSLMSVIQEWSIWSIWSVSFI